MALVSSTRVRRAQHVDIGHVGIVGLNVALQLVHHRVMRLSWVGERVRRVCVWHTSDYADILRRQWPDWSKWSRMPDSIAACATTASRWVIVASGRGAAIRSRSVSRVPESIGANVTVPFSRTPGN